MDYIIVLAIATIVMGLWNLLIAILGLFPQFLSTAIGSLAGTNTKKNVKLRRSGWIIPIRTRYEYKYSVKGKEYSYSGDVLHSKRRLLAKVPMVYVKWFPRRAYPYKFKGTNEWAMGLVFLICGTMLLLSVVFA